MSLALALLMPALDARAATFEAAYAEHRVKVYRLGLRYGGGARAFAEDLLHDVFVRLLERAGSLDEGDLGGWLYTVATNLALKKLRPEKSLLGVLSRLFAPEPSPP